MTPCINSLFIALIINRYRSFPHIAPGRQKEIGDHFLALFPCPPPTNKNNKRWGWIPFLSLSGSSSSSSLSISLPKIHPRGRPKRLGLGWQTRAGGSGDDDGDDVSGGRDEYDLSWVLAGQLTSDNSELDRLAGS